MVLRQIYRPHLRVEKRRLDPGTTKQCLGSFSILFIFLGKASTSKLHRTVFVRRRGRTAKTRSIQHAFSPSVLRSESQSTTQPKQKGRKIKNWLLFQQVVGGEDFPVNLLGKYRASGGLLRKAHSIHLDVHTLLETFPCQKGGVRPYLIVFLGISDTVMNVFSVGCYPISTQIVLLSSRGDTAPRIKAWSRRGLLWGTYDDE